MANNVRAVGGANAYGFNVAARAASADDSDSAPFLYSLGMVHAPAYAGADPHAGMSQMRHMNANAQTLTQFENNEVYGATPFGLSMWDLGVDNSSSDRPTPGAPLGTAGVLKNVTVWHVNKQAYFGYPTNGLTIDGFKLRSDLLHNLDPYGNMPIGIEFSDYNQRGLVIKNADIQGAIYGVVAPPYSFGEVKVLNSTLRNRYNLIVTTPWSVGGADALPDKSLSVSGVNFSRSASRAQTSHLTMNFGYTEAHNMIARDAVTVTNSTSTASRPTTSGRTTRAQAASYRVPPTGTAFELFYPGSNDRIESGVDLTGTARTRLDGDGNPRVRTAARWSVPPRRTPRTSPSG